MLDPSPLPLLSVFDLRDHVSMLDDRPVSQIGNAYKRYGDRLFGIKQADRLFHIAIFGQTGTGKSSLLSFLAGQDAAQDRGFCFIDVHGDTAAALSERLDIDPIYWDVADPTSPFGYNPLSRVPEHIRPLVASGFIETLKKQWGKDAWGPRMENLLRQAVLALLEQPRADMRDIARLYVDKEFRREVVSRLKDEQLRQFWMMEFPKMNYLTTADGVQPIANKLGVFLANPVVRNSVCAPRHPLRFRRAMDEGEKVIVNLAKGQIGADVANVLGGLLVANILNAAFSRHDIPEQKRRPFFLYVDEFPSLTTSVFADMLSEARKYGLSATIAAQFTSMVDNDVIEGIWGNVGTLIAFRLGATDAPLVARQMGDIAPRQYINLPNYHAFAQLMIDGRKSAPFSFQTKPPFP